MERSFQFNLKFKLTLFSIGVLFQGCPFGLSGYFLDVNLIVKFFMNILELPHRAAALPQLVAGLPHQVAEVVDINTMQHFQTVSTNICGFPIGFQQIVGLLYRVVRLLYR